MNKDHKKLLEKLSKWKNDLEVLCDKNIMSKAYFLTGKDRVLLFSCINCVLGEIELLPRKKKKKKKKGRFGSSKQMLNSTKKDLNKKVFIAFAGDKNMPWTAYIGYATLLKHENKELWDNTEDHFLVLMDDGKESYFPKSSIFREKIKFLPEKDDKVVEGSRKK